MEGANRGEGSICNRIILLAIVHIDMLEQFIKEDLSVAYVQAVAGRAGVELSTFRRDWGLDGSFQEITISGGRRFPSGFPVDYQLKATARWDCRDGQIIYDLDARMYNALASRTRQHIDEGANLCILILYCLPDDPQQWLVLDADQLLLRKCCYWHTINGSVSGNVRKVRVKIPSSQILTPNALVVLLKDAKNKGVAYYG